MEVVKFDSKISWIVALTTAFMNILIMIPTKVSGLFFVEIIDRYRVNRNIAGYPAFTITLMRCSGGPLAGYVAEIFGVNEVMILGTLLATVGISACFFAEDIATVTVFLGVIHGIGAAFTNTFIPQIMKIHFKKHVTLACGIALAGACFGSFFSPPLLLWIFQNYGTSGGFLIIGAIVFNSLPVVMIVNILSPNRLYNKPDDSLKKSKECPGAHLEMGEINTVTSSEGENKNTENDVGGKNERYVKMREGNGIPETGNSLENKPGTASVLERPICDLTKAVLGKTDGQLNLCSLSGKETGKARMEPVLDGSGMISEVKPENSVNEKRTKVATDEKINDLHYDFQEESISVADIRTKVIANKCEGNLQPSSDCTHLNTEYRLKAEINNQDTLTYRVGEVNDCYSNKDSGSNSPLHTSVCNLKDPSYLVEKAEIHQQIKTENGEIVPTNIYILNARNLESTEPSNQVINQKEVLRFNKKPTTGATNAKKSLKIFLDITYWIVMITQSVQVFGLVIFWTTMIDFSRDKSINRTKEVYLLMTLPIAEIIGRLGLGWITDGKYLTRINFSILSFILMGFSCSLMAWCQGFYTVMASIFLFGVVSSGLITVFPMIIFEFFHSSNHTMGQASRYCLFGPLSFLNGPLIGYFRGTLGSYVWLYHATALILLVCAALSALIPVLAKMRDEKKNKRS